MIKNRINLKIFFFAFISFLISFLALFSIIWDLELNALLDARLEWGILILGLLIFFSVFIWFRKTHRNDIFEFPIWISINACVQILLTFWLLNENPLKIYPSLRSNYQYWFFLALILISVSLFFLWLGYIISLKYLPAPSIQKTGVKRVLSKKRTIIAWFILWVFVTIAVPLNLLGWGGTQIGVWGNYLEFLRVLYMASFAALAILHFRNPTTLGWIWLILVVITSLINGVAIGTRSNVMILLSVFIFAYYATGKYQKRWIFGGIIVAIIFLPAATQIRGIIPRYQSIDASDRFLSTYQSLNQTIDRPFNDLYQQLLEFLGERQGGLLVTTASIIRYHPNILPYVLEDMVSEVVLGVIPRVIWSSKPVGNPQLYNISTTYADARDESSFSAIGLFADSYRAGGWLFVAVFFFSLGFFMAWIYRKGVISRNDLWLIFYISLLGIITYDGNIFQISTFFIQRSLLLFSFIFFILFKKSTANNSYN